MIDDKEFKVIDAMTIGLPVVMIDWPNLFEPRAAFAGNDPKYSATFIFEEGSTKEYIEPLIKMIAACKEGLRAKNLDMEKVRSPLHHDGKYGGSWYLKTSTKNKPDVRDTTYSQLTKDNSNIYAGCYVRPVLRLYSYDKMGGGVGCDLKTVVFVEKGEPIVRGAIDPISAFGQPEKAEVVLPEGVKKPVYEDIQYEK